MTELRIGTSGWSYGSWRGPFFPADLKARDHLGFYASRFNATELNAPFYRTPTEDAVRGWLANTPDDFSFAWKASKFITHWKRLMPTSANSIELLESRVKLLKHKLGPILFQLPPRFHANRERLGSFLKMLPKRRRYAFEFRHPSWYEEPIIDLLRDHDVSLCLSDHADAPSPWVATASFVYVRGHGPTGRYHSHYPDDTLEGWARDIRRWRRQNRDVYCFFDNDQKSAAPADAERLLAFLSTPRKVTGVSRRTARAPP
jgi:uncharacterized protein YecE (DUF72 family)